MCAVAAAIVAGIVARETGGIPFAETYAIRDVGDRGGWTRAGLTAASVGTFLRLDRPATEDELNALTDAQGTACYVEQYLTPFAGLAEPLLTLLVDWAVTSGTATAAYGLQLALKKQGADPGVPDGRVGPRTLAAYRTADGARLYWDVFAARIRQYVHAAVDDIRIPATVRETTNLRFLDGWMNRALEFLR